MDEGKTTWRFPRAFWTGNAAELCERAAYYGTFIALRTYLIRVVGLDDIQSGIIAGLFGALIYLFPFFTGALADRMGFRYALMLAFGLLTLGYGTLGVFHTLGPVIVGLVLIVLGGAFVKPVITGTVSKSSDEANRARAFSIFYMVVNIGSFTGKTIVAPMRIQLGVETVLEGGVQRAGSQVRINVQLIDANTDEHLWAEIFDRELTAENLFAIQSEISERIAAALKTTLSPEEQQAISERPTENLAAYDAYLLGRQLMAEADASRPGLPGPSRLSEAEEEMVSSYGLN